MNWICSQIGAREHYAIPRILDRAGNLQQLYTDFWASAPWRLLGKVTAKSSLANRWHADLADAPVTGFNLQALKASRRRFANPYEGFLKVGEAFGQKVVQHLQSSNSQLPAPSSTVFFGYDTGFLEPAQWIKKSGGKTIVCQMDPSRFEVELVKEEEKRWPGWSLRSVEIPEAYFRRREEEWSVADLVMVNSDWTRQALVRQGVPESKLEVVPLAYEVGEVKQRPQRNLDTHSGFRFDATLLPQSSDALSGLPSAVFRAHSHGLGSSFSQQRPLRVLFLGQVILRKGIQYLMEVAKLLEKEPVRFDVVGPLGISPEALASAPENMTFHGPVSRDRTREFYERAGLFVLPTLSDGFALTQLEAMAHGLPVIATANCGEVVTDGSDGLIVPAGDPMALAEAFQLLIQDPARLQAMSREARITSGCFGLESLGKNLSALTHRLG